LAYQWDYKGIMKQPITLTLVQHTLLNHMTQHICNNLGYNPNLLTWNMALKCLWLLSSITLNNSVLEFQSLLKQNDFGCKPSFDLKLELSWGTLLCKHVLCYSCWPFPLFLVDVIVFCKTYCASLIGNND
jgi:hypothetical protein